MTKWRQSKNGCRHFSLLHKIMIHNLMKHTDFFARIRALKAAEYKELQAAVELHGGMYEWDLRNTEHPIIAVNPDGIMPSPVDVRIYRVYIREGALKLCGVEKECREEVRFQPDEAFAGHLSIIIDYLPPVSGNRQRLKSIQYGNH